MLDKPKLNLHISTHSHLEVTQYLRGLKYYSCHNFLGKCSLSWWRCGQPLGCFGGEVMNHFVGQGLSLAEWVYWMWGLILGKEHRGCGMPYPQRGTCWVLSWDSFYSLSNVHWTYRHHLILQVRKLRLRSFVLLSQVTEVVVTGLRLNQARKPWNLCFLPVHHAA